MTRWVVLNCTDREVYEDTFQTDKEAHKFVCKMAKLLKMSVNDFDIFPVAIY